MRKIEVIILDPEDCDDAKFRILWALEDLRTLKIRGEIDATKLLAHFKIFEELDLETLQKHFNKEELEIIKSYREWRRALIQGRGIVEASTKLNRISKPGTLFSIVRKSIRLELPQKCLGDVKHTFLIRKELEKIDNYIEKYEKGEIRYSLLREEVGEYLRQINDKLNNIIEMLAK